MLRVAEHLLLMVKLNAFSVLQAAQHTQTHTAHILFPDLCHRGVC